MLKRILAGIAVIPFLCGTAAADILAIATTDLNIRQGPGPEFAVIGVINANDTATVMGCIQGSQWCSVSYNGVQGWSYSAYLTTDLSGNLVYLAEPPPALALPTVTYDGPPAAIPGAVAGATIGAIVGGPVGAAIGGAAGAVAGAAIDPPDTVRAFIANNPVQPIYLQGEVVVGATIPQTVQVMPVPQYQYAYVNVNGQPVLVEPGTHRVVYIFRS